MYKHISKKGRLQGIGHRTFMGSVLSLLMIGYLVLNQPKEFVELDTGEYTVGVKKAWLTNHAFLGNKQY